MSALIDWPKNFKKKEFEVSEAAVRAGIKNEIPANLEANVLICAEWLQVLRDRIKIETGKEMSIVILSGYRSEKVNGLVGGSKTSAHKDGLAVDFYVPGMTIDELFSFIRKHMKTEGWDQLIHEFGEWVHVGFAISRERGQCLKAVKKKMSWPMKPKTVYEVV